jgi:hypothetical protein
MKGRMPVNLGRRLGGLLLSATVAVVVASPVAAETIYVPAGGNLQAALNAAQPGDVVLLEPGATFLGNFVLPVKSGSTFITLRTAGGKGVLPEPGVRIGPAHAPYLARLQSPNVAAALRTAAGSHHWRLELLEFGPNKDGYNEILQIGDGSKAQDTLAKVPYAIVLDRLLVRGDPLQGQKRCIGLNSGATTVINSYVADCKGVGMDTQALGGWNGPGPFHIENNYLEGAGENFILGGADPHIPGLVTEDVVFRRNHLAKPVAWRDPIVPAPAGVTATSSSTGGSLAAGTYYYRVTARRPSGSGSTATSAGSVEVAARVASGSAGSVALSWAPVPDATAYRVHGRTSGGQSLYWQVTGTSFTDTGSGGTAGTVPGATRWLVKNIFELKNARRVLVEYNLMEYNWQHGQSGFAVLFTPRNQDGRCTWCVVEDVTFQYNIVRHVAAGINILGYDNLAPSRQTRRLTIRHNLFYDVNKSMWGGHGWFVMIGDEPRDIVIDHNTVLHDGTQVVSVYGGSATAPRTVEGFVFTNNLARHGTYGIFGDNYGTGLPALEAYFPGYVFNRNVLAGGSASQYPPDNYFPSVADFLAQFSDPGADDYRLGAWSSYLTLATDGTMIGADIDALLLGMGAPSPEPEPPPPPLLPPPNTPPAVAIVSPVDGAVFAQGADVLFEAAASDAEDGDLSDGLVWTSSLDGTLGTGASFTRKLSAGTHTITAQVTDSGGLAAEASVIVEIVRGKGKPPKGPKNVQSVS